MKSRRHRAIAKARHHMELAQQRKQQYANYVKRLLDNIFERIREMVIAIYDAVANMCRSIASALEIVAAKLESVKLEVQ